MAVLPNNCRPDRSCSTVEDVPGILLSQCRHERLNASLVAVEPGVTAGCEEMVRKAGELGLDVISHVSSGQMVEAGQAMAELAGSPLALLKAEDLLLSLVGKYSGVASAAARARQLAGDVRVVCGGWKKMPLEIKPELRRALEAGGIDIRIIDRPFVYVGKNYVRVLGSVAGAMQAAGLLAGRETAIQISGETEPIHLEAQTAVTLGAKVVFVDTGNLKDLRLVSTHLRDTGLRAGAELAFAGGVTLDDLPGLAAEDVDVVDMGRALIDAPLLDCRYQVMV